MKWQDAHLRLMDSLRNQTRTHHQHPNDHRESSVILGPLLKASHAYQKLSSEASPGTPKNKTD